MGRMSHSAIVTALLAQVTPLYSLHPPLPPCPPSRSTQPPSMGLLYPRRALVETPTTFGGVRIPLIASLSSPQVCHACFTIDVAGTPSDLRTDCLRDGGDVWRPAERGCNIVPCGAKLNRDIAPRRFTVTAGVRMIVSA